ncbi:hypothetical protein OG696_40305 [Streptomyces sp. NBC_00656]|uniref:hypothetical protein n=1 Tax=Streptomyces sp. NBC_00656 TaxID=2903668 RepID=UPI00324BC5A6
MTTLPRQRGLTEQAAAPAIDTASRPPPAACRLPPAEAPLDPQRVQRIADRAMKDRMTDRGFLAALLMT